MLVLPVFTFVLQPLSALYSRKHEFEADAFAAQHASAAALTQALVKLYEDNAATLTPDPLHSAFYDSHPPAAMRIARLVRWPSRCRRRREQACAAMLRRVASADRRDGRLALRCSPRRPADAGDAKLGQAIVDKDCDACHVRRFGDKRRRLHACRPARARRLRSFERRSRFCNTQLGTGYFPDEEEHIAAYLESALLQVHAKHEPT